MGLGEVIILASNIGLALIVWRIHRRLEGYAAYLDAAAPGIKELAYSELQRRDKVPPAPPEINPRLNPLG